MIEIKFTGGSMDEIKSQVLHMFPTPTSEQTIAETLEGMTLQEIVAVANGIAEKTSYEVILTKKGRTVAEQKKEEARAKLRGDLVDSVAEGEKAKAPAETETPAEPVPVEVAEDPSALLAGKAKAAKTTKAKINGAAGEEEKPVVLKSAFEHLLNPPAEGSPAAQKARAMDMMKKLYKTNKAAIDALAKKYAKGDTRQFALLPDTAFASILKELEAIP